MNIRTQLKQIFKKIRATYLIKFVIKPKTVGRNFYCGYNSRFKKGTMIIGNDVYIGNNCHLSIDNLVIKDYVMLASQVSIVGGDHRFDIVGTPIRYTGSSPRKGVIIGMDCWIGHGVIILDGVEIREGTIVAAGAVVTKSLDPYSIYAGMPAKKIGSRFKSSSDEIVHHKAIAPGSSSQFQNEG